jgi:hypothetical protein
MGSRPPWLSAGNSPALISARVLIGKRPLIEGAVAKEGDAATSLSSCQRPFVASGRLAKIWQA